jgi:hypothetical protein
MSKIKLMTQTLSKKYYNFLQNILVCKKRKMFYELNYRLKEERTFFHLPWDLIRLTYKFFKYSHMSKVEYSFHCMERFNVIDSDKKTEVLELIRKQK